ncbi:MAG TPA: amidohydrolase family protein [Clostridia bacterium]|jgi:hypothetical protein|nr:amidohydrolase family protein [Clostridia bacterium]
MQIIDTHVHYGSIGSFDMKLEDVFNLMRKKEVNSAIISSIENAELYAKDSQKNSIDINKNLLDKIKDKNNLYMQYWIRPRFENMDDEIERFIQCNLDKIRGLKIHPFTSSMCINDKRIIPYLEFANKSKLTVSVHTAKGYECECRYLANICSEFPSANFIAVHMDLGTDHKEAVHYVNKIPNLYGDVSWIPYKEYKELDINEDKVIFGSDIPINMNTAYDFYDDYFINKKNETKLFYINIYKLFFNKR